MQKSILNKIYIILLLANIVFAQRSLSFGWHEMDISVDNSQRYFKVYVPKGLHESVPVVFVFHSENGGMENIFDVSDGFKEWPNLADREKFILIIPNGVNPVTGDADGNNQKWNDCRINKSGEFGSSNFDDVKFISELVDWSNDNLDIDKNRIYMAGIGNGGMMVFRLAIELGDLFAAGAVFLANMAAESECGIPVRPIAMFIMNSKDDSLVPFEGGEVAGNHGEVTSSDETLNYWVSLNQLNAQKRTNKFYEDINPNDNSRIIKNEFDRPLENPHVVFNVVTNSGHVVPSLKYSLDDSQLKALLGNQNRDVEGVEEAWKFLRKFSLR